MTRTLQIEWTTGAVRVDLTRIEVTDQRALVPEVARLCKSPETSLQGKTRYRLSSKVSLYGHAAECVVEVFNAKLCTVTLLFDLIEFFNSTVLESRIVKAVEKASNRRFVSSHPSTAELQCDWGKAEFQYDPKQGDLSLTLTFI